MFSLILAPVIHELGHYLVALTFGHHLVFRRQGLPPHLGHAKRHATTSATYSTFRLWKAEIIRSVALSCRSVAVSVGSCGTSDGLSVLCGGLQ